MTGTGHNETDGQELPSAISLKCIWIGHTTPPSRNLFNVKGKEVI
jgi:hypothetical protein